MIDVERVASSQLEPTVAVDADGVVVFANPRFLSITQQDRAAAVGADYRVLDRFIEAGFDAFDAAVSAVAAGESDQERVELTMRHPETAPAPRRVPAEARVTPITEAGRQIGVLIVWRNITGRKERERELRRQNERLEEFVSVVSHDLRNPLNVAMGRLSLAVEEPEDPSHLAAVADAHDRMLELIEDLLAVARGGDGSTETEWVDLASTMADCWRTVTTGEATYTVEGDLAVRSDRGRLRQLLENLVRNAVEHGTTDRSTAVAVTVGELDNGFYVADDGSGIPPEDRERAFDRGFTTTPGGTGFGLSIVKEVAEDNGWDVAVTAGSDGGARFEFTGVAVRRG